MVATVAAGIVSVGALAPAVVLGCGFSKYDIVYNLFW